LGDTLARTALGKRSWLRIAGDHKETTLVKMNKTNLKELKGLMGEKRKAQIVNTWGKVYKHLFPQSRSSQRRKTRLKKSPEWSKIGES